MIDSLLALLPQAAILLAVVLLLSLAIIPVFAGSGDMHSEAREVICDACRKPLEYRVDFDTDGVILTLCAGCAGEAAAFSQYGDDAMTTVDWREVRRRVEERS